MNQAYLSILFFGVYKAVEVLYMFFLGDDPMIEAVRQFEGPSSKLRINKDISPEEILQNWEALGGKNTGSLAEPVGQVTVDLLLMLVR